MPRQRIVLTVVEEVDCPLFGKGDRMVLSLPGVDMRASSDVCTLTVARFLPIVGEIDCADFDVLIRNYRFHCPRPTNPVLFEVEEIEEEAPVAGAPGSARSAAALKTIPVFRNLSLRALERILHRIRIETFADGDVILEKGQPGRAFHIVYRGAVEVLGQTGSGRTGPLVRLEQKECFGETSILTGAPVNATVRAAGPAALLSIDRSDFERMLQENPILAGLFTRLLADRLTSTNRRLTEEGAKDFTGKLAVLSLAEVVQNLGDARRSGTLVLTRGGAEGRLGFVDGRVHEVRLGPTRDEAAFFALMAWEDGEFWFDASTVPPPSGEGRAVMELLLEGMRRIDETRRIEIEPDRP